MSRNSTVPLRVARARNPKEIIGLLPDVIAVIVTVETDRSSNYSERGLFYYSYPPNRHSSLRDGDLEKVRKAAQKRCRRCTGERRERVVG